MHQNKSTPNTLFLIGCGGHARAVADIALHINPGLSLVFLDDHAKNNETIWNFPCRTLANQSPQNPYIIALGDNVMRKQMYDTLNVKTIISIVSPLAYISTTAQVKSGTFVGNFCNIGTQTTIGNNTIINTGAIVEHESSVGNHCHIAPNAAISGKTTLGDLVFVGTGASIIDKIQICSNVIIGAGATVVENITRPGTYVGTPARKIK